MIFYPTSFNTPLYNTGLKNIPTPRELDSAHRMVQAGKFASRPIKGANPAFNPVPMLDSGLGRNINVFA